MLDFLFDEFNQTYKFIPTSIILPKVILIHGWDFEERNFELPTTKAKKLQILEKSGAMLWKCILKIFSRLRQLMNFLRIELRTRGN
ncbi:hypothetical protein LEP1GSC085_2353 [Leptospira interrogans str. L0996]|nr:hypothetical protein LEP1GSC085_2353 [Leptospira interrogans str. L0996]